MSTYVSAASGRSALSLTTASLSCLLNSMATPFEYLRHPHLSSVPCGFGAYNIDTGKQPKGPVLCIQNALAPCSYRCCQLIQPKRMSPWIRHAMVIYLYVNGGGGQLTWTAALNLFTNSGIYAWRSSSFFERPAEISFCPISSM